MPMPSELQRGYRRFRAERFSQESQRYRNLTRGQQPRTMIIGCADSRVDPATIFSAAPGELFVVRNVAALVPPCEETGRYHGTSAALEFAVTGLEVQNIVVMGHGLCGGVAAALAAHDKRPVGRFIKPWVDLIQPLAKTLQESPIVRGEAERQKALERMAIQESLANLMTFPFVKDGVEANKITLHGAWFSIGEGELHWLDWDRGVLRACVFRRPGACHAHSEICARCVSCL